MPVVETSRRERKVTRFLRAMAKLERKLKLQLLQFCPGAEEWSQMLSAVVWGLILCQVDSVLDWEFWVT